TFIQIQNVLDRWVPRSSVDLDERVLGELAANNPTLFPQMIDTYSQSLNTHSARLRTSLVGPDWELALKSIRSLSRSSRALGIREVIRLTDEMTKAVDDEDVEQLRRAVSQLRRLEVPILSRLNRLRAG
ncbi:MAG: hypothetical protein AAF493_28845, partial [Pseudomonadota bacterium]